MHSQETKDPRALDESLKQDHLELEKTFQQAIDTFCGGDCGIIRESWLELDRKLEAHLKAEEELMLPQFAQYSPAAADRIAREHGEIRAALQQLGIDLDLHELRKEVAEEFIGMLRKHAAYEEQAFYAWAQARLAREERHAMLRRLVGVVRPAQRSAERVAARE